MSNKNLDPALNNSHRPGDGSTGPRTLEGKDRSSRNGLVHGARSEKHVILPNESEDEFNELHQEWIAEYKPETKLEIQMIELIAKRHWHFLRCERLYEEAQEKLLQRNPDLDSWTEQDHRTVQLATRYRNTAERAYKSARADFDTLRKNRIAEALGEEKYKAAYYANCKIRLSGQYPDPPLTGPADDLETLEAEVRATSERANKTLNEWNDRHEPS